MSRKMRVSETFYFDFNGEKTDKIHKDLGTMLHVYLRYVKLTSTQVEGQGSIV